VSLAPQDGIDDDRDAADRGTGRHVTGNEVPRPGDPGQLDWRYHGPIPLAVSGIGLDPGWGEAVLIRSGEPLDVPSPQDEVGGIPG
jgi:hypothetical protein